MENLIVKLPVRPVCTCCQSAKSDKRYDGEMEIGGEPVFFCKPCAVEMAEERMNYLKAA